MPRLVHSHAEWLAIARELDRSHAAGPPGLAERVAALLRQAPSGWPDQIYALELDEGSAEAVHAIHAALAGRDPNAGQRAATVAEAEAVIRDHQQRP